MATQMKPEQAQFIRQFRDILSPDRFAVLENW
jgi:hypothetical protein